MSFANGNGTIENTTNKLNEPHICYRKIPAFRNIGVGEAKIYASGIQC